MKKQAISICVFLVLLISILACGSSSVIVNTPTTGQSVGQVVPTTLLVTTNPSDTNVPPAATVAAMGTSRSNPAPVGSQVAADDMQFVVTGIVRPVDIEVAKGNMFNDTPVAGSEYMFVSVSALCTLSTDQQCTLSTYYFKLLGSDGVLKDTAMVSGVSGLLSDTTFYGGSTVKGNLPFLVTKGDTKLLLVYQALMGDTFYLALPAK